MSDLEVISLSLTAEYMGIDSLKGVFQAVDLTPANVHDIHYLKDIKQQLSDCTLLGDKGYLSSDISIRSVWNHRISVWTHQKE